MKIKLNRKSSINQFQSTCLHEGFFFNFSLLSFKKMDTLLFPQTFNNCKKKPQFGRKQDCKSSAL